MFLFCTTSDFLEGPPNLIHIQWVPGVLSAGLDGDCS